MQETTREVARGHQKASLTQLSWESITQPGAYVDLATGKLYRVPREALLPGASPVIHTQGAEDLFAKISDDPFVPTLAARSICADNNISPTF